MSYFLDRLQFFAVSQNLFANGHGEALLENRDWEDSYRARFASVRRGQCAQHTA
ncbi:MAG: hypothetical protein IPK30_12175 [Cellvibrionales bacterium]|nr:hypothetical protein [Cellvibrionales bacterium]